MSDPQNVTVLDPRSAIGGKCDCTASADSASREGSRYRGANARERRTGEAGQIEQQSSAGG